MVFLAMKGKLERYFEVGLISLARRAKCSVIGNILVARRKERMKYPTACVVVAAILCLYSYVGVVVSLNNGVALLPPMGWSTWNTFACDINETVIKQAADIMVASGLRDRGYVYVNLDDCWMAPKRDANGNLYGDPVKFPSGMKALGQYIHSKGLKYGIYASSGNKTCGGFPGSWGYEKQDAFTFASWEVDFMKLDCCGTTPDLKNISYPKFTKFLNMTGRPIVYSCDTDELFGESDETPWLWGPTTCNMWRTWHDIKPYWWSWTLNLEFDVIAWDFTDLAPYAGPGQWNDPDMLEVGVWGMSDVASKAHFSLWSILAAPLIMGQDLRNMTSTTLEILSNAEVIAVNQDKKGLQGRRSYWSPLSETYYKPLSDGSVAVVMFNKDLFAQDLTVSWQEIGLPAGSKANVRDLWKKQDLGVYVSSYTATDVAHSDVSAIRVSPA